MELRIQKYLSQIGICSRRKAESYLANGLIKINGKVVTTLGTKVDPKVDKIELNKKIVKDRRKLIYILLNKPKDYVTTCARHEERSILELVPSKERIYPVGRLDKNTTGLILFTNDGPVAYRLTHPKFYHEKEYLVTVNNITRTQLDKIKQGVKLDKKKTKPTKVKVINSRQFTLTLTEGKYHHIKRIVKKVGSLVEDLKRIRIENLEIGNLQVGKHRKLTTEELKELKTRLRIPQ